MSQYLMQHIVLFDIAINVIFVTDSNQFYLLGGRGRQVFEMMTRCLWSFEPKINRLQHRHTTVPTHSDQGFFVL